jgi:hypothetical protein
MRPWFAAVIALAVAPVWGADKLTLEDRVELTRGLTAEYATVKQLLPRSKKALPYEATGAYDKQAWTAAIRQYGPAARVGDLVQVTKISIGDDRITLEINGGFKSGRKWYDGLQIGMGTSTRPVRQGGGNATAGTTIDVLFHHPLTPIKAAEVKALLAPVLDFSKRSVTEVYTETLKPEVRKAIAEKKVLEGMDRDQVLLAMGHPDHKSRETDKDGLETEDWVFGKPPGKIVFVTFDGDKVIKVKEAYAGLGTEVADPPTPR